MSPTDSVENTWYEDRVGSRVIFQGEVAWVNQYASMAAKFSKIPVIDTTESSKIPVFVKSEVKQEPGEIDEDGFTFIGTFNSQDQDSSEEHSADITEPITQIKDCMVVISATEQKQKWRQEFWNKKPKKNSTIW